MAWGPAGGPGTAIRLHFNVFDQIPEGWPDHPGQCVRTHSLRPDDGAGSDDRGRPKLRPTNRAFPIDITGSGVLQV